MTFQLKNAHKIVALGDSITYGMNASTPQNCWASRVTTMLEDLCGHKLELSNRGICGNILSVDTPAYQHAVLPAGLERIEQDIIDEHPDILFLAFGFNDARGGTETRVFRRDYQNMIDSIRAKMDPLIVCLNLFYMHESMYTNCEHWEESNLQITEEYNLVLRQIAEKNNLIYADIYSAQHGCDWLVSSDHCHPNDLGHQIIANRVFEAIVRAVDPEN